MSSHRDPRLADIASAVCYRLPMTTRFRGIVVREGMLIPGPAGWGDFCPFPEYDDAVSALWLAAAVEQCTIGWPVRIRDLIPVNCIVPAVDAATAYRLVEDSGCRTAKVKVLAHRDSLSADIARVEAVRAALGPSGAVRIDVNGEWDVDEAVRRIRLLDRAASGLEYVEQPCARLEELAQVRRRVDVRVAADESVRRAADPLRLRLSGQVDLAVVKSAPLGGVRRALRIAEALSVPCVVSSALESTVGLAAEVALAGALPNLPFACGLGTGLLLREDVVTPSSRLRPVAGALAVPAAPPAPDLERLRSAASRDRERERWWRLRLSRVAGILGAAAEDGRGAVRLPTTSTTGRDGRYDPSH